jgi:hypothetical protein
MGVLRKLLELGRRLGQAAIWAGKSGEALIKNQFPRLSPMATED